MEELRIAVVGAGMMGADHVTRITERIVGARVSAIVEPDEARGKAAAEHAPGALAFSNIEDAIAANAMDAVLIATPGQFHEPVLLPAITAGLAILCEKPLTMSAEASLRIVEAEIAGGKQLIQVGFMRRFDQGYIDLRELIVSGKAGELLAMNCAHRNPAVPDSYTNTMLIEDSVVHEIDVVRFLTDSPIAAIEVKHPKRNKLSPDHLDEPIFALLYTESGVLANVEMNVSVQFGYQVKTEAIFQKGIAEIGRTAGLNLWQDGLLATNEHMSFKTRFAAAYDSQIQRWVNATLQGKIDGPSAWDGYLASAAVTAGVEALTSGKRVEVDYAPKPAFYN
ncbi:myo-inositol 2-dehydrogenase/D-chiro-inositol 1-dehydrogenase [Aurantimicrobium minutum]|uniref:Gfo/Idh/MocA family protein n=1 Tax=Aurantimicrobium minutum TaxID=708131 RepID=UPI002406088F|nr:Gfo/Idh/MocA family oxidoreductase [Aurantimicrobium minutum]MDF9810279.1 myo-inositol 2-dehydrogenase/D-chiro-inositol 1-dehydrogenase [Aurantimicrobium minutum]